MATVFAAPESIQLPKFDFSDMPGSKKEEERYIQDVKDYCLKSTRNPGDSYVGKMLAIPHADGKACYLVLSTKPLQLVHLQIGDAWDSPYADLFTLKKVKEHIDGDEKLKELFTNRQAENSKA